MKEQGPIKDLFKIIFIIDIHLLLRAYLCKIVNNSEVAFITLFQKMYLILYTHN